MKTLSRTKVWLVSDGAIFAPMFRHISWNHTRQCCQISRWFWCWSV